MPSKNGLPLFKYTMQNTLIRRTFTALSIFTLAMLMLSLPTSKAGMNIFSALLALGGFTYALFNIKNLSLLEKYSFIFCLSLYAFGGVISFTMHPSELDFAYYMQKNSFWLLIPVFVVLLKTEYMRRIAIVSFVIAASIAGIESLYDAYLANFDVYARSTGFLGHSRHANSMLLCIALSLLMLNKQNLKPVFKDLFWLSISIAMLSLLVSGSRGAWLGGGAMLCYTTIRFHKTLIKPGALFVILLGFVASSTFPEKVDKYLDRAKSIVQLELSGMARLTMWRGGVEFLGYKLDQAPSEFLFGTGMYSTKDEYLRYVDALPVKEREHLLTNGSVFGGSDFHHSILDVFVKSGVLYSSVFFGMWAWIIFKATRTPNSNNVTCQYMVVYFVGLFVIYQFYTIAQDYATYATAFAISLLLLEMKREPSV
ncbi:O-antigen ligase family protein [Vibrio nigripulchritudo]|uniref:O-antigen ligase family protein n=1 Tax=Vibrio nigripulchritudo TaxID=28173 RepID=UPI0003B209D3|nr:O-antigen ligase family protein [Vibrio nigripulchritudo]CCN70251.1 putative Lipid A core-O-antigen ligase and related enzyme [Vibrio nigripulchritudo SFn118]